MHLGWKSSFYDQCLDPEAWRLALPALWIRDLAKTDGQKSKFGIHFPRMMSRPHSRRAVVARKPGALWKCSAGW